MTEMRKDKTDYLPIQLINISATDAAKEAIIRADESLDDLLQRHRNGDWGNLSDEDKRVYDAALKSGSTVFSEFITSEFDRIWIYTAIGKYTKIYLPNEN